ncbi:MAG: type II toxin-antitoxin system VapC family toxin [Chloroflexi bacterium]|nr:type II toxin-antitoxin system VapC family toxin [Chloroflexota bacterium]
MYLLDTDILSNLLRRSPSTNLITRLASVPREQQFTSSITLGELFFGAHRSIGRTESLLKRIDEVVLPNLPILPFDARAARHYGEVGAELERQGIQVGDADLRIASIALAHGLTLVTGNVRHFQWVPGLAVENWLQEGGR